LLYSIETEPIPSNRSVSMTRTFAIRLDARKYATVTRLARRRRATLSEVVREALDRWIELVRTSGPQAPYVAVADLVGAVDSQTRRQAAAHRAGPARSVARRVAKAGRGRAAVPARKKPTRASGRGRRP
jgi:hypothetical protein